jgi:gamma-tubulin complex component 3
MRQLEFCSHIGQSREMDIGHLSDLVKRRRAHIHLLPTPLPNARPVSVSQSRPDGALSVQFTNLLSRLLEQVPFPPNGCAAGY